MTRVTSLDSTHSFRTRAQAVHIKGLNAKECLRKEIHQELFRDDTVSLQIWKMFHNKNSLLPSNKRILNMSWRIYSMDYLKKTRTKRSKRKILNVSQKPCKQEKLVQPVHVASRNKNIATDSTQSTSNIGYQSLAGSSVASAEFASNHVFVNSSPSDFKGAIPSNMSRSNADIMKQNTAGNMLATNIKHSEASQEFDYIEHIRRLSGGDDDPMIHFAAEDDVLEPSLAFYGKNTPSQPIPIATNPESQPLNFTKPGSSFDSDGFFSPIDNGSFSSTSGFSSYRKSSAGITPPMSTKSSFSAYPPSVPTFNSVADIPSLASTGSYQLQRMSGLQKNYNQLRQPARQQTLESSLLQEINNNDKLSSDINFDDDLKDIIDFSKFSDCDADMDLIPEEGNNNNNNKGTTNSATFTKQPLNVEEKDASLRYSLDSYISTLELSLNKHEKKRKLHVGGSSGFALENVSYPTPMTTASSSSSPSKSHSSKGPSPSSLSRQSNVTSSLEPSSISSTVLPGSSLLSRSCSFDKTEFRGHPVCENCLTSNTPLWRKTSDNRILCNACGLFFKLHGIIRPPVKNKFARGRLQAEMKKLRNYHQIELQTKARNPRDRAQIASGSQIKFHRMSCEKPIVSFAGSSGNIGGKRMRDNDDWSWLNFE